MVFFTDLDNTLVYSHRRIPPGEVILAEILDGRAQGYMTKNSYDFLKNAAVRIVPVTLRTPGQYSRLSEAMECIGCRQALLCGGGILFRDGEEDTDWTEDTRAASAAHLHALREAERYFRSFCPPEKVHGVEGIMVYAAAEDPEAAAAGVSRAVEGSCLTVYTDSRKVYCLPPEVNKGEGIRRLAARMGVRFSVAAGDGLPDVPMLEAADLAVMPESLAGNVRNPRRRVMSGDGCFADFICDVLKDTAQIGY
ncbi:MAG: HAD hydrolase family protein [Clostridia bacterium]|nr:HAD hydrolase family protein [Clostridia bacterium]